MRRILILCLAIIMISSLHVPVIFADNTASITESGGKQDINVNATYVDNTTDTAGKISVDVTWGKMQFTYTAAGQTVWNEETHQYDESDITKTWSADGNTVKVINHSSTAVTANFSYNPATGFTGIGGSFDKNTVTLETAVGTDVENAPCDTVTLTLSGELASTVTTPTKIGTVTVAIEGNSTSAPDVPDIPNTPGTSGEGLVYTDNGTTYSITSFGDCTDTEIVIPATHNGKPVIGIGDYAFYGHKELTSVVIPASVTDIGQYAFAFCENLERVMMENGVASIGEGAFSDCTELSIIVIPDSVTAVGAYTFKNCNYANIYCEAASKPYSWDVDWYNGSAAAVYWGDYWQYVDDEPILK